MVIGRPGRNIDAATAVSHVVGYTVINDVSGRDVQFRPNQMDLGKGFDTFVGELRNRVIAGWDS